MNWWAPDAQTTSAPLAETRTPGGLVVLPPSDRLTHSPPNVTSAAAVKLHLELIRLRMLRGFDELLCLEGLHGIEHLPHQIETVRKVLRHFRGRVLLADEVGLGKTIEACLLLREFILRGLVKRVLILTPAALTSQWHEELAAKFSLDFAVPVAGSGPDFWSTRPRVLASLALAKSRKHFDAVAAAPWDLVIVDEAHHCKNRSTRNWQLVNALTRRHLFLLSATPVQNNLIELYNLLTLLEPGHLKTEADFKNTYVTRGNPRDPRNRNRLRDLLSQVMIRNTRGMVQLTLPKRYAQTFVLQPAEKEATLYRLLNSYLRWRLPAANAAADIEAELAPDDVLAHLDHTGLSAPAASRRKASTLLEPLNHMQINAILMAAGSHPLALAPALARLAAEDDRAAPLHALAGEITHSAKEEKLLELLRKNAAGKTLVFANFRATIERLAALLTQAGLPHTVFSGNQSTLEKQLAVDSFRHEVPIMLCSDSAGEGHNLQFANTLINFDLPWNPMRIEQRIGRVHRIGQTREVFIFNLCTAGSIEQRVLGVLDQKIRMFELVVGEVGAILGNLDEAREFESLVLDLWLKSSTPQQLDAAFDDLGESMLKAQEQYLQTKELDEALFGEDYQ